MDEKDWEHKIKGLEEGYWRAIGNRDVNSLRDAAVFMYRTLHDLADVIESLPKDK